MRVRAVWLHSEVVQGIFLFLWVCVVGTAVTVPVGISGAHIGPTMQCVNTRVADYTEATAIMALINDSAIFAAVTYRILKWTLADQSLKTHVNAFFGYRGLSRLSRALLEGGQHYYLIAVCGNIVLLVFLKDPRVPPVYHAMLTIPVVSIVNAMACIVFRKIRFNLISPDGAFANSFGTNSKTVRSGNALPEHYRHNHGDDGYQESVTMKGAGETNHKDASFPLQIRIVQETEMEV